VTIVNKPEDPDSRDLIFASQTLIKGIEKVINKSQSLPKSKPVYKTKWTIKTYLQKVKLTKDIRKMKTDILSV